MARSLAESSHSRSRASLSAATSSSPIDNVFKAILLRHCPDGPYSVSDPRFDQ